MEIGDQRIHHRKRARRINENGRVAAGGSKREGLFGDTFQYTHSGGAHGDDTTAFSLGEVDGLSGGGRQRVAFGVHGMLFQSLRLHRSKGAEPDVQGDGVGFNALRSDLVQQRFREMKPGGGCGDGAGGIGIDSLIPLCIGRGLAKSFASDVRRQRHFAERVEGVQ